jgi:hypothetical protein
MDSTLERQPWFNEKSREKMTKLRSGHGQQGGFARVAAASGGAVAWTDREMVPRANVVSRMPALGCGSDDPKEYTRRAASLRGARSRPSVTADIAN